MAERVPDAQEHLRAALELLADLDLAILRARPGLPSLADSGVRCGPSRKGCYRDVLACLAVGSGDAGSLAAWRVAELRRAGIEAEICLRWEGSPNSLRLRVFAHWPDGRIEDALSTLSSTTSEEKRAK